MKKKKTPKPKLFKWYDHEVLYYKTKKCKGYIQCRKKFKVLYLFQKIPVWRTLGSKEYSNKELKKEN